MNRNTLKILLAGLILALSSLLVDHVSAIEGTCSSHRGVNCAVGFDLDGSAVCNDGWRNSSEMYRDQNVCKDYEWCPTELNATKSYFSCVTQEQLQTLKKNKIDSLPKPSTEGSSFSGFGGLSQLTTEEMLSLYYGEEISQCEKDIERYEKVWADYNKCQDEKLKQWTAAVNSQLDQLEEQNKQQQEAYNLQVEQIKKEAARLAQNTSQVNSFQVSSCPINSSRVNGNCICNTGFVNDNNICIEISQHCRNKYGPNTSGKDRQCFCTAGYEWNSTTTYCIEKQQQKICPPTMILMDGRFPYCDCKNGEDWSSDVNKCVSETILDKKCQVEFGQYFRRQGEKCYAKCHETREYNPLSDECLPKISVKNVPKNDSTVAVATSTAKPTIVVKIKEKILRTKKVESERIEPEVSIVTTTKDVPVGVSVSTTKQDLVKATSTQTDRVRMVGKIKNFFGRLFSKVMFWRVR